MEREREVPLTSDVYNYCKEREMMMARGFECFDGARLRLIGKKGINLDDLC